MNYRKVNNLVGWIIGAIAYIVYIKTMEPTVSFWDCGEFLSCAYRLEVGHSPGAPFFMLVQRLFGMFAPSADKAAMFINSLSVLTSALTILFLFWTITHLAKKMVSGDNEPNQDQTLLIMGAGIVGALAYTFSDTFWFSAVEAEVYGTSSFFTAITFWSIFKWERVADKKYADRWLLLIFYLIGVSVAVHLLNLLTIPAIIMVYYYKRYETTPLGTIIAFLVGCAILGFVQFGVIQYIPQFASKFDILFVNNFGLPIDSGAIVFLLLLVGLCIWLLFFSRKKGLYLIHTGVLCLLFVVIGYSSYIVAIIRSRADVPVDMTNPDNVISFLSYVNREQFGQQPLFFGPDFTSQPSEIADKGPIYTLSKKANGKEYYEVVGKKLEPEYDASQERFFPRMYDNNEAMHINFYRNYVGLGKDETPSSADNLKYFWDYQMNWMWWRYFMWNYAGRQNDFEGQGEPRSGNWISGIKFIDNHRVGDIDLMSYGYRNNGARNELYFLPLILGLFGLFYHFNKDKKGAIVVMVLFFFTGAAIGIFLNMPPVQPRERDYAFAGCTFAFAMWIGLGVLMVNDLFQNFLKGKGGIILTILLCLGVAPVLMAKEEWWDHDRSKKTLARDVAYNTLMSCAPNAILFTAGDNQTYPLWYLQEVEGIRHDVRIINTSLLGIDWYIDQMNYRINDADALPMIWKRNGYIGDHCNYIRYIKNPQIPDDKYFNLEEICNFITSDDANNKVPLQSGETENYFPTKNFFLPAQNKDYLVKAGLVKAQDTGRINTEFKFTYPKNVAYKSDIAILNIIAGVAKEGWKRPIYFDAGLPADNYVGVADYLHLEGILDRVMPYKTIDSVKDNQVSGTIDVDKSYNLFMNVYSWNSSSRTDVYFDEPNRREFFPYRMDAAFIANNLSEHGRKDDAVKILDKVMAGITQRSYDYDFTAYYVAAAYFRAGASKKGMDLSNKIIKNIEDDVNWTYSLDDEGKATMGSELNQYWQIMSSLGSVAYTMNDTASMQQIQNKMRSLQPRMKPFIGRGGGGGGGDDQ